MVVTLTPFHATISNISRGDTMKTIKGILLTIWNFIKKWWHYLLLLILFIVG